MNSKNQKAFIQIPILIAIIAFMIISGATAVVVSQKKGEVSDTSANVFQKTKNILTIQKDDNSKENGKESRQEQKTEDQKQETREVAGAVSGNEIDVGRESTTNYEAQNKKSQTQINTQSIQNAQKEIEEPEDTPDPSMESTQGPKPDLVFEPEPEEQIQNTEPQINPCDELNCDDSDGWVNIENSYACCDANQSCVCQKQEYRDYYCSNNNCDYSVSDTKINQSNCQQCSISESCTNGVCQNNCDGVDTNCGTTTCINCNAQDGWFDKGFSYDCCDDSKSCSCQEQEYRDYYCFSNSCEYSITNSSTNKISCNECETHQSCTEGACQNNCQGTDTSCGLTSCQNCNNSDGCSGSNYLDYRCSNNSCVKIEDDCSDCSCFCGGYNVDESLENNNCDDGKDNDCDGNTDSADSGCVLLDVPPPVTDIDYKYDSDYPILLKMDGLNEVFYNSYGNGVSGPYFLNKIYYPGDVLNIYAEAYDPKGREIFYKIELNTPNQTYLSNTAEITLTESDISDSVGITVSITVDTPYHRFSDHDDYMQFNFKVRPLPEPELQVLTSPLSGNITQNSKLTLENNPYIVTEIVQVLEGITLEIEPGVTIKFQEGSGLKIGGELLAIGTIQARIIFTSENGMPNNAEIIFVDSAKDASFDELGNYVSGSIIQNSEIKNINQVYFEKSSPFISDNTFHDLNKVKIYYTDKNMYIQNNVFSDNTEHGILISSPQFPVYIKNNMIEHNEYGIVSNKNAVIENNVIQNNNLLGVQTNSNEIIRHNTIANNNKGLILQGQEEIIERNILSENDIGLEVEISSSDDYTNLKILHNNIYNNLNYNIEMTGSGALDIDASNNFWGTTDISEIDEKIYDYYDDIEKGTVNYQPIATSEIPDAGVQ